jgi:hypothetical protein
MRAVIIEAGIGGLAAAVALRRVGVESLVAERAGSICEIGAGLALWSNAVNALRELGVESQVMNSALAIERNLVRTRDGHVLTTNEFGDIIRNAGARCVGFSDSVAIFENGERIEADFLVGAGSQFGVWLCGAGQLYWFLTRNARQGTAASKAEAVARCRDWAAPVPGIIGATPEDAILQRDIVDRPPLRYWGRGGAGALHRHRSANGIGAA